MAKSKVVIELNQKGVAELLKSPETQKMLQKVAQTKAGSWKTDTKMMGTRVIASIYSDEEREIREELDAHRIVGGL